MRPRTVVLGVVAAVAVLAALPSAALANRSAKKAIWGPVTVDGKSEFPVYQRLGVGIFEMDLDWWEVARTRPQDATDPADSAYEWPAEIDYAIQQASIYHMRVLLQVIGTPGWANAGKTWNYPPGNIDDLARFLTAASRRYPSVHLWMIWGEPDRHANFALVRPVPPRARTLTPAQARAPHVYAQMLDASYGALKAVSERNLVIGGNTFSWGVISTRAWVENLRLPDGRPPRMDLYGDNPFTLREPDLSEPQSEGGVYDFSDVGRLDKLVNQYLAIGRHRIGLFLSEWTIPTAPGDTEFNFWVEPRVAARWVRDAWQIVRRSSFIYALGWINVYDGPPGKGSTGGLFTYSGGPKPVYYAFKNG